jgi:hypothetical protein
LQREALSKEPDPFQHMRHMLEEPDEIGDVGVDRGCTPGEQSKLLFRRYTSQAIVEHYFELGVPISVVITNQEDKQRLGVIVSKCNQWWLLPLCIDHMQFDDDLGFTYFQIRLHPTREKMLVQSNQKGTSPHYHIQLLNYAILLPALWLLRPVPYALITMEGLHLDAAATFV